MGAEMYRLTAAVYCVKLVYMCDHLRWWRALYCDCEWSVRLSVVAPSKHRLHHARISLLGDHRCSDQPPPSSQPETVRRLASAGVNVDRQRLVGHYGGRDNALSPSRRAPRPAGRALRDTTAVLVFLRRGRAAKSNQESPACVSVWRRSSRRLATSFCFHRTVSRASVTLKCLSGKKSAREEIITGLMSPLIKQEIWA